MHISSRKKKRVNGRNHGVDSFLNAIATNQTLCRHRTACCSGLLLQLLIAGCVVSWVVLALFFLLHATQEKAHASCNVTVPIATHTPTSSPDIQRSHSLCPPSMPHHNMSTGPAIPAFCSSASRHRLAVMRPRSRQGGRCASPTEK